MSLRKTSTKQTFLQGALVLAVANVVVKIIGAIFRIPLTNLIGKTGMGYFNSAYLIYSFLYVLATAGIPVAISRIVASKCAVGKYREAKKTFRVALTLLFVMGLFFSLLMGFGARVFCDRILGNSGAYWSVVILSPAVFAVAIMAAFRGYYQGLQNMIPTAVSQIIEAAGKLLIGYGMAAYVLSLGASLQVAAGAAISGVTLGTLLGLLYTVFVNGWYRGGITKQMLQQDAGRAKSWKSTLKEVVMVAVPITIGSAVMSFTSAIDGIISLNRLQSAGFSEIQANDLFGIYTSYSQTLFNFPIAVLGALDICVIPVVAAAFSLRDQRKVDRSIASAFRICTLVSIPCSLGLLAMARPVLNLLYASTADADLQVAAKLLQMLGVAVFLVSAVTLTTAVLQALGRMMTPIKTMAIGGVVKIICSFFLVGTPQVNIYGAPIGTILCYGLILTLNMIAIIKTTKFRMPFLSILGKPFFASLLCIAAALGTYTLLYTHIYEKLATLCALAAAVLVYALVLLLTKAIEKDDILMLPNGTKIAKVLEKRGWIR